MSKAGSTCSVASIPAQQAPSWTMPIPLASASKPQSQAFSSTLSASQVVSHQVFAYKTPSADILQSSCSCGAFLTCSVFSLHVVQSCVLSPILQPPSPALSAIRSPVHLPPPNPSLSTASSPCKVSQCSLTACDWLGTLAMAQYHRCCQASRSHIHTLLSLEGQFSCLAYEVLITLQGQGQMLLSVSPSSGKESCL